MEKNLLNLDTLDAEALAQMVEAKTRENLALMEEAAKLRAELQTMTLRSLKVHEENEMMKASPEIAARFAEMKLELDMAARFVSSGAFPKMNAEQAYTVIRAGAEMGLKPVESLNTLYIVNGAINPYGKNMIGRLTSSGYRVEYLNEKEGTVDVKVTNEALGFSVTETATEKDEALRNSRAMGMSKKNKLRYHGVRMVINFHLPHLFNSTSDFFQEDALEYNQEQRDKLIPERTEYTKQRARIADHIAQAQDTAALLQVAGVIDEHDLRAEYETRLAELEAGKK